MKCLSCGAELTRQKKFCSRICYRSLTVKTCPSCQKEFHVRKSEQLYCSKRCAGQEKLRSARTCTACGVKFLPTHPDQQYCSQVCKSKSQETGFTPKSLTFREFVRPPKGHWRSMPPEKWGLTQYWSWLRDSIAADGFSVLSPLPVNEMGKLRQFHRNYDNGDGSRGVTMARLRDVGYYLIRDFSIFCRHFSWTPPFTPGTLIGFWPSIVAVTAGKCTGIFQQYDPNTAGGWETVRTPPEESKVYGWDGVQATGTKPASKKTDWQHLEKEKWSATTVWAAVSSLRDIGNPVQELTRHNRKDLNALIAQEGILTVGLVVEELVKDFSWHSKFLPWDGPIRPKAIVGFWPAIKKTVLKKVPYLLEVSV